jgi:peptide/nickel transport system substrate-binding protein
MTYAASEIGTHGGRFVIGETSSPKTFNAMLANESSSTDVTQLLFCTLADFDNGDQRVTPYLAKSWDVTPDGKTWTWHMRRGAAFSDGHPITSEDVLFSFEVAYDDSIHPSVQDLLMVQGKKIEVSAPDSYTVVTKIAAPYALMVNAVGALRIMPKHVLGASFRHGAYATTYNTSTAPESLVTSGPWKLKQFVPNEKTVLTPNPYWFGVDAKGQRLPYLDELVFLIAPDQNAVALKFQAGELDGLDNVRPEDYQGYSDRQQKENFTLYDLGPALNTNQFWFNLNRVRRPTKGKKVGEPYVDPVKFAWFNNPVFRRAVSMAIDRDAIIKSVLFGEAVKNWSTSTPANKAWYWPELPRYDYAPDSAKKLLAGLGWKDRNHDGYLEDSHGNTISFTIKTNGDNVLRMQMCNFIKDDLAKVGIKCASTGVDFNTLITNLRSDFQYEAIVLGLQSGVPPDPGMGQNVWRSTGLTHYWDVLQPKPDTQAEAQIDQLMTANVSTTDTAERKRTWNEIQRIVNQECFLVWLPTQNIKVPVRNRFGNVHPVVIPNRLLWNIDRVFVKPHART